MMLKPLSKVVVWMGSIGNIRSGTGHEDSGSARSFIVAGRCRKLPRPKIILRTEKTMARLLAGLLLVFGGVTTALAAGIEVTAAYARATPPGAPVGGAYFEIRNRGDQADRLLAAASPVAGRVELHTHTV